MFTTFSAWVDLLFKAAGHKYIRRIPYTSGGKLRYRYIYKVTHTAGGKHALHEDDVTVGAAFMLGTDKGSEVHAHVKSVDGDKVTVEYDDGPRKGKKETMSRRDLLSKLDAAHGISQALQGEREKQAKVISELRASGASEKQIAREQARLDRLGVEAKEPAPKKRAPKAKTESSESKQSQLAEDVEVVFNDPELLAQYNREAGGGLSIEQARVLADAASLRAQNIKVEGKSYSVIPELSTEFYEFFFDDYYERLDLVVVKGEQKGKASFNLLRMSRTDLVQALKDPKFQELIAQLDEAKDNVDEVKDSLRALRAYTPPPDTYIPIKKEKLDRNRLRVLASTKVHETVTQSTTPDTVMPAPVSQDKVSKSDREVLVGITKSATGKGMNSEYRQVYHMGEHIVSTDGARIAMALVTEGEQGALEVGRGGKFTQGSQQVPPIFNTLLQRANDASKAPPMTTLTSATRNALRASLKPFTKADYSHNILVQSKDGQIEFTHENSNTVLARVPQVGASPVNLILSPLYLYEALASDGDMTIGRPNEPGGAVSFRSPHMVQVVMPRRR
jgi:hypothetical protein